MSGQRSSLLLLLVVSGALVGCDDPAQPVKPEPKPAPVVPGPVDADAPEEFTTTESGLKYRFRRKSDGKKPTEGQATVVLFRGWLDDGTYFDTTYGTGGAPRTMDLKSQVAGWMEGLMLAGEGSMIELEVPPKLGYGEFGRPGAIPPNQTLHFLVEVLKVVDIPPPPADLQPSSQEELTQPGPVDSDAPEEFTTTSSGLKYRIRRKSSGKKPKATDTVTVNYRGWRDDNHVFDSSYRRTQPQTFGLPDVVAGWREGMLLVPVGGMIELEIPPDLGYGPAGRPPEIPPNATLHFIVELLEIK